jgi:putative hydrolase of the HAD superfamily
VIEAVLLDAFGTLLELESPAPVLAAALELPVADCERAFAAEIAFYRAHMLDGRDAESLAVLRAQCAAVLGDSLGRRVTVEQLLSSLSFRPFPEVPETLAQLQDSGLRLVVTSNWDVSLCEVLEGAGLTRNIDGVVTSAACGVAKPDPFVFQAALRLAGVDAAAAVHVGDSVAEDVVGARAAGVSPVLIVRQGEGDGGPGGPPPAPPAGCPVDVPVIGSLAELPALLAGL